MTGQLSFSQTYRKQAESWPRWWLWAAAGMTVSLMWTLPFAPLWAVLGGGLCAIGTLIVLTMYARNEINNRIPLKGEEILEGKEADRALSQIDEMLSTPKGIEQIPQVDEVLQTMAADNQRRRLEDLMRRWVDVAQRYGEADRKSVV